MLSQTIPSGGGQLSTYNGRKISDYDLICVMIGDISNGDVTFVRGCMVIPVGTFIASTSRSYNIDCIHGTATGSLNGASLGRVGISYNNDTTFNVWLAASEAITGVRIDGLRYLLR